MPLKPGTPRQIRFMAMAAHDPAMAARRSIKPAVARELLMSTPRTKRRAAMRLLYRRRRKRAS